MIAETTAYKILNKDKTLNELFDQFRGSSFGNGFTQGIFTYDIPENPTNLKKAELAPFMRINNTYDGPTNYADDSLLTNEQRITINFWCKSASQADLINSALDNALEANGFERYTANENPRKKDSDINLLMNVRKYRFFDWK
ncbi:phage protein [Streptococcus pseudoporcinus]|uniref:Phage protein n=1 Tax=Streptococcus pseudoporcinus TaxID=361101 RepID=A0A4U9Y315_9STRE|nr:hypothetical protein [Streptococcus pseudoporcinus]VTS13505.1 phage protein [Streptococcus pseudoporcinus]VTS20096.1 phage protein [Streptococcus pseudoporcinus]